MADTPLLRHYTRQLPKTRAELFDTLKDILEEGAVQDVRISVQQPIRYTRLADPQLEEIPASPMDVARNIQMEELERDTHNGPHTLVQIAAAVAQRQLYLTHICYGNGRRFCRWLELDPFLYGSLTHLIGAQLIEDQQIPQDSCLCFAGPFSDGVLDVAAVCIRCCMPSEEDAHNLVMHPPEAPHE